MIKGPRLSFQITPYGSTDYEKAILLRFEILQRSREVICH